MHVSGKFAMVTGSAQGIGRAIATKLLESGAAGVCLVDINQGQLEVTAKELQLKFPAANVCHFVADLCDKEQHERAFAYAAERLGKLHILANNAGVFNEKNPELVAAVNLVATYRGTLLGLQYMRQDMSGGGEGGVVINVSSLAGLGVLPGAPIYCGTKHAVIAVTRSLAINPHYLRSGVRLSCLCPGLTDTDLMTSADLSLANAQNLAQARAAMMKPEAVAKAFVQLVADDGAHGKALKVFNADETAYHEFLNDVPMK